MAAQLATKKYDVLLLLPEISQVYAENYAHSDNLVAEYKAAVKRLLAESDAKAKVLWTPLASADSVINGYLNDTAVKDVKKYEARLYELLETKYSDFLASVEQGSWSDQDIEALQTALQEMKR
jgi:F0F1-type ATP synthase alpha subunit